ncbi:DEAD/DEAH box helicase [Taibaiella koreensis]|uniref:DEAD/DEAH box helicase n=1 Tax=Taibaiella koreensis TaxID=1268548 RepID=UPI001969265A|nr:DEAD/DEAH box helicase [Taibaiella koreensis]
MTFEDFQLDDDVLDGIHAMGYRTPTPIQEQAIPLILEGKDLIACAQTGTGKTAAFMLPLLHKILQLPADGINTLILVPTRELAIQIDHQVEAMGYYLNVKSLAVYGGGSGQSWVQQKQALTKGADIIIATPGRLIAQMQMGGMDFSKIEHLVLDEADRMLDMGFYEDIIKIVSTLPKERQTLCFSATMPPRIRKLTQQIQKDPLQINIAISKPAEGIRQLAYMAHDEQKHKLLLQVLLEGQYKSVIIFSSSKEKVKRLEGEFRRAKINARAFHSDLVQEEREKLMLDFKNQKIDVLVGTDVLSRGIHVEGIDLVVNYDVPPDPEDYVHRIGRTARAASTGTAITFVNEKDLRRFHSIEKLIGREIEQVPLPESLGKGPAYHAPRPRPQGAGSHSQSKPGGDKAGKKGSGGGKYYKKSKPKGQGRAPGGAGPQA